VNQINGIFTVLSLKRSGNFVYTVFQIVGSGSIRHIATSNRFNSFILYCGFIFCTVGFIYIFIL